LSSNFTARLVKVSSIGRCAGNGCMHSGGSCAFTPFSNLQRTGSQQLVNKSYRQYIIVQSYKRKRDRFLFFFFLFINSNRHCSSIIRSSDETLFIFFYRALEVHRPTPPAVARRCVNEPAINNVHAHTLPPDEHTDRF
jgi:hypothetical protein